jgi:hypothetical protein
MIYGGECALSSYLSEYELNIALCMNRKRIGVVVGVSGFMSEFQARYGWVVGRKDECIRRYDSQVCKFDGMIMKLFVISLTSSHQSRD